MSIFLFFIMTIKRIITVDKKNFKVIQDSKEFNLLETYFEQKEEATLIVRAENRKNLSLVIKVVFFSWKSHLIAYFPLI